MNKKEYSIVSGGFDPIHIGHINLINNAAQLSKDGVIVIMNSDEWLEERKHKPLLSKESRYAVLSSIKNVVKVYYDDLDTDGTVSKMLAYIRTVEKNSKLTFCNGGDRSENKNVPECDVCNSLNIKLQFGVGGTNKDDSSSIILAKYVENLKKSSE